MGREAMTPSDSLTPEATRAKAEALLREHWVSMGCDHDEMATLDTLGENERQTWLDRAREGASVDDKPTDAED